MYERGKTKWAMAVQKSSFWEPSSFLLVKDTLVVGFGHAADWMLTRYCTKAIIGWRASHQWIGSFLHLKRKDSYVVRTYDSKTVVRIMVLTSATVIHERAHVVRLKKDEEKAGRLLESPNYDRQ